MTKGIIIFGPAGSGKTTLGKAVAESLGFPYYDLDYYIWRNDTEVPFTQLQTREEKTDLLMCDIVKFPNFVMAGSMNSFSEPFVPLFSLAVFLTAPIEICIERITERQTAKYGNRIKPGGDMYENHLEFIDIVSRYYYSNESPCYSKHTEWAETLPCPVLRMDGTLSIAENTAFIVEQYLNCTERP